MVSTSLHKIFSEHIQTLSDVDFFLLVHRLLNKIFPKDYRHAVPLTANGYTIINANLFSVIPSTQSVSEYVKKISPLTKNAISGLTILTKTDSNEALKLKKQIGKKIKKVIPEVWDSKTIAEKVKDYTKEDLLDVLGDESTISSYFRISAQQTVAFDYYQEVFSDIVKNFIGPFKRTNVDKTKIEFTQILEKVPLNFSSAQLSVWDMYSDSYQFKLLAEKFIQEQFKSDDDFKESLISEIRSSFRVSSNAPRHNYPVNDFMVIEIMAQRCLRPEYKNDPKFLNVAKGIIFYLFELCEFGARNTNDHRAFIEPNLFDEFTDSENANTNQV